MAERRRLARADVWWGAMLPHMKKPPQLREFIGEAPQRQRNIVECIEAWEKVRQAQMRARR